ncbi:hypothetical protein ABKN59_004344 [Abortiporus biennis]
MWSSFLNSSHMVGVSMLADLPIYRGGACHIDLVDIGTTTITIRHHHQHIYPESRHILISTSACVLGNHYYDVTLTLPPHLIPPMIPVSTQGMVSFKLISFFSSTKRPSSETFMECRRFASSLRFKHRNQGSIIAFQAIRPYAVRRRSTNVRYRIQLCIALSPNTLLNSSMILNTTDWRFIYSGKFCLSGGTRSKSAHYAVDVASFYHIRMFRTVRVTRQPSQSPNAWKKRLSKIGSLRSSSVFSNSLSSFISLKDPVGHPILSSASSGSPGDSKIKYIQTQLEYTYNQYETARQQNFDELLAQQEQHFIASMHTNTSKVDMRNTKFEEAVTTSRLAFVEKQKEVQRALETWEVECDKKYHKGKVERSVAFENAMKRRENEFLRGMESRQKDYGRLEEGHDHEASDMSKRLKDNMTSLVNILRRRIEKVINEEKGYFDDSQMRWETDVETMRKEFGQSLRVGKPIIIQTHPFPTTTKPELSLWNQIEDFLIQDETVFRGEQRVTVSFDEEPLPSKSTMEAPVSAESTENPKSLKSRTPHLTVLIPARQPSVDPSTTDNSSHQQTDNPSDSTAPILAYCHQGQSILGDHYTASPTFSEFSQVPSSVPLTTSNSCRPSSEISKPLSDLSSGYASVISPSPSEQQLGMHYHNLFSEAQFKREHSFNGACQHRESAFTEIEERFNQEEGNRRRKVQELFVTYQQQFDNLKEVFCQRFTFADEMRTDEEKKGRENRSQEEGEISMRQKFLTQVMMFEQRFKAKEDGRWWDLRSMWQNEVGSVLRELEGSLLESVGVEGFARGFEKKLRHLGVRLVDDKPQVQHGSISDVKEQSNIPHYDSPSISDDNDQNNNVDGTILSKRRKLPRPRVLVVHNMSPESSDDDSCGAILSLEPETFFSLSSLKPLVKRMLPQPRSVSLAYPKEQLPSDNISKLLESQQATYNSWRETLTISFDSQMKMFATQHETSEFEREDDFNSALAYLSREGKDLIFSWQTAGSKLPLYLDGLFAIGETTRKQNNDLDEKQQRREFRKGEKDRSEMWRARIMNDLQRKFREGEIGREKEYYKWRVCIERDFAQKLNEWRREMRKLRGDADELWEDAITKVRMKLSAAQRLVDPTTASVSSPLCFHLSASKDNRSPESHLSCPICSMLSYYYYDHHIALSWWTSVRANQTTDS